MTNYKKTKYWELVEEFLEEIRTADYWLKPDGQPLKEWELFEADTLQEARNAAEKAVEVGDWNAKWNAKWSAAFDATENATDDAARTAALDAAEDAADDAARSAAFDAADGAAFDAAISDGATSDVALFACMLVCYDLDVDFKHKEYCNRIMEVWRKGYCLLCDVDGVLYVYAKRG